MLSPRVHCLAFFFFGIVCSIAYCQKLETKSAKPVEQGVALETVAERSNYTATANAEQVHTFLETLSAKYPSTQLISIGQTVEGRELEAIVIGRPSETKPVQLPLPADDPRHVVLAFGGIHSGECDGKEALLALARDLLGTRPDFLEHVVLVILPNLNADANERRGKNHRPGQVGPDEGMGLRENAQGLDLNRDFVKLETPEIRSLVRAIDQFGIDCFIDMHTTNGSLHRYQLTYDVPHNPAAPASLLNWLHDDFLIEATARMKDLGFDTFYYGNTNDDYTRWETYGHEPRYSTDYMGLRGRIGILSESYSYASYEVRVKASYAFAKTCFELIAEKRERLTKEFAAADSRTRAGVDIPLQAEVDKAEKPANLLAYAFAQDGADTKSSQPTTKRFPSPANRDENLLQHEYSVEVWNRCKVNKATKTPAAYWLPDQYAWAVDRLSRHGVVIERTDTEFPSSAKMNGYRIKKVSRQDFQGLKTSKVEVELESIESPAATSGFLIRTEQPLGMLASYMLEPESDDSLLTWGFFGEGLIEGQLFPVLRLESTDNLPAARPITTVPAVEALTLERLMSPTNPIDLFDKPSPMPRWLNSTGEYLIKRGNAWLAVEPATGAQRYFGLPSQFSSALSKLDAFDAESSRAIGRSLDVFNADFSLALVEHKNDLFLFDVASGEAKQLTETPNVNESLAELSPDGKRLAYVIENDLYVQDITSNKVTRLTDNGTEEVLNGILDWVYQEEIYGRGNFKAFWWSPDGQRIAFLRLDQTPVDRYQVNDSITFRQELEETRYPKAGAPLPSAEFAIAEAATGKIANADLSRFPSNDRLLVNVGWHPSSEFVTLQVQNRIQSNLELLKISSDAVKVETLFKEESPAWIDMLGNPTWLSDGSFLWRSDLPVGRRHLFHVLPDGQSRTAITQGDWDVESVDQLSKDENYIYVTGNLSSPIERCLIAVPIQGGQPQVVVPTSGTHTVSVSKNGEFFIDRVSSLSVPPITKLHAIDGTELRTIEAPINDHYRMLRSSPPKLMTIRTRDGLELQSMLIAPPGVDVDNPDKAYPVVIHVYAGPRAPTVKNAWGTRHYGWHQYLAEQGYFVLLCDNRSASGRGSTDTWKVYKDLGKVEMQDLEDTVGWLEQQAWADKARLGIWGWSYGGYFTGYAMTHSKFFKAGISGAPVTDWRNYDSIYTERYMSTPELNPEGYKTSSVVEAAANLSGELLIIHGERDDNVHMANTMQLVYALQKAGKQFELMVYPKNRHAVVDSAQQYHLYRMMTDFFLEKL